MSIFDSDRWYEIYSALSKNKLRTFLTAFGVFWGLFMLIIMLGSGNGLQNGVTGDFAGFATNSFYVWTQRTSKPYAGLPPGRNFNMTTDDITAISENIPELAVVAPRNQLGGYRGGNNVSRGTKSGAFSVMGDYPEIIRVQNLIIREGRFLNKLDINEKRKVCVIGQRVFELLFKENENAIGDYIYINGVYFKVIGIFKTLKSGDQAERDLSTIYVPFTTFQQAFNYGNDVGWFAFISQENVPASLAEEKTLKLLAERHKVHPDDDRAFGHFNAEEEYTKMQGLFNGIRILIWIVGTGTLLAGVIGVSNIMLIIVKERTKEIGIRRAIGAPPRSIVMQIILEAIMLTSVAGYFGLLFGVAVLEFISTAMGEGSDMFKNPSVDLDVALKALVILIVSGALAGLIPAARAVKISTVDALRSE